MRPAYESDSDRSAQQAVADALAQKWDCVLVKTPKFYQFDYTIVQRKIVKAFCEIKVRTKHYPTLLLSLHKWQIGMQMAQATNLPFLIISSTPAGMFWMHAKQMPVEIVLGGRTDRGDDQDQEPCVLLPYSGMVKL